MTMYLGVRFLGSHFFGTLSFLGFLEVYFLCQIGEVLLHYIFQYVFNFLFFLFFWHPYDSDVRTFKVVQRFLSLSSFFWILVSSFCSCWMLILPSGPNYWFVSLFPFRQCWFCVVFFISLQKAFTSSSVLWPYSTNSVSTLITSVLNSASHRLAISLSLSYIIFWSFDLLFNLGHIFFCLHMPVT